VLNIIFDVTVAVEDKRDETTLVHGSERQNN